MGSVRINETRVDRKVRKKTAELLAEHPLNSERSGFDTAFLCGLLEERRPKKIVEVGVAGGGTTAIILQCLHDLDYDFEMVSIDASENFYREKGKPAGYLGEIAKERLQIRSHRLITGGVLPDYIDEIGDGIDFLILDTTHSLPGEILDFLTALPYLKDGALVCLHDIRMNLKPECSGKEIATAALFSSVTGVKYLGDDDKRTHGYPNIGAFEVGPETRENIADVAAALVFTWKNMPREAWLDSYLKCIRAHYGEEVLWIAERAVAMNRDYLAPRWNLPLQAKRLRHGATVPQFVLFLLYSGVLAAAGFFLGGILL